MHGGGARGAEPTPGRASQRNPGGADPSIRASRFEPSFARIDLTLLETLRAASTHEVHMLQHEGRKANELEYWSMNASIRLFDALGLRFGARRLGQKVDSTPERVDVLPETINDVDDAFAEIIHKSHWVRVGF